MTEEIKKKVEEKAYQFRCDESCNPAGVGMQQFIAGAEYHASLVEGEMETLKAENKKISGDLDYIDKNNSIATKNIELKLEIERLKILLSKNFRNGCTCGNCMEDLETFKKENNISK